MDIEELKVSASLLGVPEYVSNVVIDDERFPLWSGSSKEYQHHYGKGGLLKHTCEVIRLCILNNRQLEAGIDERQLFLAALFHDCGKMWDYEPTWENRDDWRQERFINYHKWNSTNHKRQIHHISRSGIVWSKASENMGESQEWCDEVLHAILAHHGQREWGSPVGPNTKLAWMLHLCDCISARMDDATRWDQVRTK